MSARVIASSGSPVASRSRPCRIENPKVSHLIYLNLTFLAHNIFLVILGAVQVYWQHHKRNTRTPSCRDKRQIWKCWETAKYGPTLTDKLGRWVKKNYICCQIVFCCFVVHFCCYYNSILFLLVIIVLPSINNNYFCRTCLHLACACEELHML